MIRFCCCLVRKEEDFLEEKDGTSGGTRTHTLVKEADFESRSTWLFL
jgi:hypothetical protein